MVIRDPAKVFRTDPDIWVLICSLGSIPGAGCKLLKYIYMKRQKVKHFATTIRFSEDGRTWSPSMTTFDFVKRAPTHLQCVEVTEVMSKEDALKIIKKI